MEDFMRRKVFYCLRVGLLVVALFLSARALHGDVTLTTLYSFGVFANGVNPASGLALGSDGYFYGTTYAGGNRDGDGPLINGNGTVFRISASGAFATLHAFDPSDGFGPQVGLVQGSDGYFYGTTPFGGYSPGVVFKIDPSGAFSNICDLSFSSGGHTLGPSGLVQGSDGNFYGTTFWGGNYVPGLTLGSGTVFKISAGGAFTTLYAFSGSDGANPAAGVVQGSDGNFYGTTEAGGTNGGFGTVFKITTNGAITSLHSFTGGADGANPYSTLVQGSNGNFYGMTYGGGTNGGFGTIFEINASGAFTGLYSFTSGSNGFNAQGGLVQASDGNFYGTTFGTNGNLGTVFELSSSGAFTTLYSFAGPDGANPVGVLVRGIDGSLYGTTENGGVGSDGTVFRLTIAVTPPVIQTATPELLT
jgi:uncharacterized repeat protein (TIGR03803 family)